MSAYISEIKYSTEDSNFIEVAVPTGTDVSGYSIYIYDSSGTLSEGDDGGSPFSLGTVQNTIFGKNVYVVDPGEDTLGSSGAVALVDETGTVIQFISFNGNTVTATEGPASGQTSTNIGSATGSTTLQSTDGGASYSPVTESRGTIPCYAPGTLIVTPRGLRAAEDMQMGDLVDTLDAGPLPIRWLSHAEQPLDKADHDARPVLIRTGAFGAGCPARDLVVSPQHRILAGNCGQLDGFFDEQCFVPAKALTCLPGIRMVMGKRRITWVHFALDSHEVVTAEGCLTESLLLGPMVVAGLAEPKCREVRRLFGTDAATGALNGPPARRCLRAGQARRALADSKPRMGHARAA